MQLAIRSVVLIGYNLQNSIKYYSFEYYIYPYRDIYVEIVN